MQLSVKCNDPDDNCCIYAWRQGVLDPSYFRDTIMLGSNGIGGFLPYAIVGVPFVLFRALLMNSRHFIDLGLFSPILCFAKKNKNKNVDLGL